jgi:hypothetical protein
MRQTRIASLLESLVNVAIGYVVALASQVVVFPLFGVHVSFGANAAIGLVFTVISILRSYCVRRLFERWSGSARR